MSNFFSDLPIKGATESGVIHFISIDSDRCKTESRCDFSSKKISCMSPMIFLVSYNL